MSSYLIIKSDVNKLQVNLLRLTSYFNRSKI